jgi:hypothetical protein
MSNRIWTHTSHLGERPGTKSFGTAALHHEKYEPWNAFQSQDVFGKVAIPKDLFVFMRWVDG